MLRNNYVFIRKFNDKSRIYKQALDGISIGLGLWCSCILIGIAFEDRFLWGLIVSYLFFIMLAEYNEVYDCDHPATFFKKIQKVILSWGFLLSILTIASNFFSVLNFFTIDLYLFWFLVSTIAFATWRLVYYQYLEGFRLDDRRVAIAGGNHMAVRLAESITKFNWRGEQLIGIYDDRSHNNSRVVIPKKVASLGNFDNMISDARAKKFDVVYLVLPLHAEKRMFEQTEKLADTTVSVYIVPDFTPFDLLNPSLTSVNGIPLVSIFEAPFLQYYSFEDFMKRLFDIFFGLILLSICIIPMTLIACGIKMTSKGPVIFRQNRYGIDGHRIEIYKFRSMDVCEKGEDSVQAVRNDPRVTTIGRYLRKYSLDELPQLFNVLMGTMSLVGPRPHSIALNERFRQQIHGYMLRHKMKPGMTGWAQVNGFRGQTDTLDKMKGRIQCDLEYLEHWTLYFDFKIILLTILRGAWVEGKNKFPNSINKTKEHHM